MVMMFVMMWNSVKTRHREIRKEYFDKTIEEKKAFKELKRLRKDLALDKKLDKKIDADLADLDDELKSIDQLAGNELQQVEKLAELLRKATAAVNKGSSGEVHQYQQALSKGVASLIMTMRHERVDNVKLRKTIERLGREFARWNYDVKKERKEEENFTRILHRIGSSMQHTMSDEDYNEFMKRNKHIIPHLRHIHHRLQRLQAYENQLIKLDEELSNSSYEKKHLEASSIRSGIMNQDFTSAQNHLDNLHKMIRHEPQVIKKFQSVLADIRSLLNEIASEEQIVNSQFMHIFRSFNAANAKGKSDAKAKEKVYAKYRHQLANDLKQVSLSFNRVKLLFNKKSTKPEKQFYQIATQIVSELDSFEQECLAIQAGSCSVVRRKALHSLSTLLRALQGSSMQNNAIMQDLGIASSNAYNHAHDAESKNEAADIKAI